MTADPLQLPETGYAVRLRFARDPDGEWYSLESELLPATAGIAWLPIAMTAAALVAVLALLALRRYRP